MATFQRILPRGATVLWLIWAGGCVNLDHPWLNGVDAHSSSERGSGGNSPATTDSAQGGATTVDEVLGMGGVTITGTGGMVGAGGGGTGGAAGAGGFTGAGGSLHADGGAGGSGPFDGGATTGSGGVVATGGNTVPVDAHPPEDQAQKNDSTNSPDSPPPPDTARDVALDAPVGTDVAVDVGAVVPTQGLVAYYPCELANGTSLPDLSGKGNDAVLTGTFNFATGQVGKGLVLTAVNGSDGGSSGGFATLPKGIVAGATELTVAAWFKVTSSLAFQRIFDFGTSSTTSSMYFTPRNSTDLPQFTIRSVPSGGSEIKQNVTSKGSPLVVNEWHHVAVVLDATGGHLYLDGVPIGDNTGVTLRPADLGAMPNNWIGRSEFNTDPHLDGMIDEFRVYNRGLTASEIDELFAAR